MTLLRPANPRLRPRTTFVLCVTLAVTGFVLATAAPAAACGDGPDVSSFSYTVNGAAVAGLAGHVAPGDEVTATFSLSGCGTRQLTFVSYNATSDFNLPDQTVFDVDSGTFSAGSHNLTITVPPCYFQLDLVYGAAITHFNPDTGVTYHGQGRFIDGTTGGTACVENPPPPPPPCLDGLVATANADGTVTLSWPAVAGASAYQVAVRSGADWTPLAPQVPGASQSFTYASGAPGATVEFQVVALSGPSQPLATYCAVGATVQSPVETTAVPDFPTPLATAMALAATVAVLALVLRRKT